MPTEWHRTDRVTATDWRSDCDRDRLSRQVDTLCGAGRAELGARTNSHFLIGWRPVPVPVPLRPINWLAHRHAGTLRQVNANLRAIGQVVEAEQQKPVASITGQCDKCRTRCFLGRLLPSPRRLLATSPGFDLTCPLEDTINPNLLQPMATGVLRVHVPVTSSAAVIEPCNATSRVENESLFAALHWQPPTK